ncbi:M16 family metallopeptidase [Fodinicurvata halophila]|uniref:M16 family metallopeptidase n=1 Tax=Fodinicurvata halophila TaxID=1419723 RepID=A0ABV8UGS2_9PROT
MTVQVSQLDNGLTVATDHMEEAETVSLGVWIGVGTRHEVPEQNGVAHLLEHMMFKGTERRSARAIAEEIEAVGGLLNAYTGRESTAYHAKVLTEDMPLALDLIADILQSSRHDGTELERERSVVLQEIGQAEDTPDDIIFDLFQETAYPEQGIGRPVLGRPDIVQTLQRDDLIDFQSQRYGAERMVLSAAGKVDHEDFLDRAAAAFGSLPRHSSRPQEPAVYRGGDLRLQRDLEQVHVLLGFDGVGYDDPDYYAAAVFSSLLGGGMSSRLFQEVRETRGLVYSIFAFHGGQSDSGLFGVYAGTGEAEAGELLPVVCDEILRAGQERIPEEELHRAKAQLKASILMGRERSDNRAEHLASQLLVHGRPLSAAELVAKVEAVTEQDIQRFVARMLTATPTLTTLGPISRVASHDSVSARLKPASGSDVRQAAGA